MTTIQFLFIIICTLFISYVLDKIKFRIARRRNDKTLQQDLLELDKHNFVYEIIGKTTINCRNGLTIEGEGYTGEELTDFGNYILSDKRKNSVLKNPNFTQEQKEEHLKQVSHADFENWLSK